MPLSIGATWPTLKPGFTAAAEDMTAKFEWLEGDRLPMYNGELTTSAYDWGTPDYLWGTAYCNKLYLGGNNITPSTGAKEGPFSIRAFAKVTCTGSTITSIDCKMNISTITSVDPAVGGMFNIYLTPPINTTTSLLKARVIMTAINGSPISCRQMGELDLGKIEVRTFKPVYPFGTMTAVSFCLMVVGE